MKDALKEQHAPHQSSEPDRSDYVGDEILEEEAPSGTDDVGGTISFCHCD